MTDYAREWMLERAAILEYEAKMPREHAERVAKQMVEALHMNTKAVDIHSLCVGVALGAIAVLGYLVAVGL